MAFFKNKRLVLVTGAPRSGTTPIGHYIAKGLKSNSIYEPLGPTGDVRFHDEFPIVDTGSLTKKIFNSFIDDINNLKLTLKPQHRPTHTLKPLHVKLLLKLTGSRTLHTLRLAKLKFWNNKLVWKDPHAIMTIPDILSKNIDVVVTLRPPLAQASSYKRLNWRTDIKPIYARYKERYGEDKLIEPYLEKIEQWAPSVLSAAIVWRMAYSLVIKNLNHPNLHIISATSLEQNEVSTYRNLFEKLDIPFQKTHKLLKKKDKGKNRDPKSIHDFTRSIKHTNNTWKESLTTEEIETVNHLTADIFSELSELA